jgi:hypothetical protein
LARSFAAVKSNLYRWPAQVLARKSHSIIPRSGEISGQAQRRHGHLKKYLWRTGEMVDSTTELSYRDEIIAHFVGPR